MAPRINTITHIEDNTPQHKTIYFSDKACREAQPGQFVMVWIPGIDEIPMSLSVIREQQAITVEAKGPGTNALNNMMPGDMIGIRGPYGHGFRVVDDPALVVAGGTGMAPLLPLLEKLKTPIVVLGARTDSLLLFRDQTERWSDKLYITTDDGSDGHHGLVTDVLNEAGAGCTAVYTCGPEIMMKKVVDWGAKRNIPVQASLERYMKCGIGICDACAIDGRHVCQDGPVFTSEMLVGISDFAQWKRAPSGKKVPL